MIRMELGQNSYNIELQRGNLNKAGELLDLSRKVMIITDTGVPIEYARKIAAWCKEPYIKVVNQVNKLLTKIQLQMDKIEKICVSYGFI